MLEFQLVLWGSSSHSLPAQGHFLLVFVNDSLVLEDDLPGLLSIGQVSYKRYLRNKKNTIGTIGQGFLSSTH